MASRKRTRVQPARSSLSDTREGFLPNIANLIDNGGQISVGGIGPIKCAAVASDDDICYAMLQRRPRETLQQLLERLDTAIDTAITTEDTIDEINTPRDNKPKVSRRR